MKTLGVLALQGGYDAHLRALNRLGVSARLVRSLAEIEAVDGLILPGGESTTLGKLLGLRGLLQPLRQRIAAGLPVLATCAGMILLANTIEGQDQPWLGGLDITVRRNAYGRQTESFEASLAVAETPTAPALTIPGIFIRAPQVTRVGPGVEVWARFEGLPVLVRQGALLAASFHPELTESGWVYERFLNDLSQLAT